MTGCIGTKTSGEKCGTTIGLSPDGYCIAHDEKRRGLLMEGCVKGGHASGVVQRAKREADKAKKRIPKALKTPADAVAWSSWLADATARGEIDVKNAREVGLAIREFRASFKVAHQDAELDRLRADVGRYQQQIALLTRQLNERGTH